MEMYSLHEGEVVILREASPLFDSPLVYTPSKERGRY